MPRLHVSVSVSRRLLALAAAEVLTVGLLMTIVTAWLLEVEFSVRFLRTYALPPVAALGTALVDNGHVQDEVLNAMRNERAIGPDLEATLRRHARELSALNARFRTSWRFGDERSSDAAKARAILDATGNLELVRDENAALHRLDAALDKLLLQTSPSAGTPNAQAASAALSETQTALRALRNVNLEYLAQSQSYLEAKTRRVRERLFAVGILGTLFAGVAAFRVRAAIAPRLHQLVTKVQRFREIGVHERTLDTGKDEIAVLGNAIDAGFSAITERDRERERFLASAAHELKTPITAILGFVQVAMSQSNRPEVLRRRLDVVERQALRLSRLVEDLLLTARARAGELSVRPAPTDLVRAVHKAIANLKGMSTSVGERIVIDAPVNARILADEELLQHAVFTLLAFASNVSAPSESILIAVTAEVNRSAVKVDICVQNGAHEMVERALAPFGAVVYEREGGARGGGGLFLCREIARAHGGGLRVEETERGVQLVMELSS